MPKEKLNIDERYKLLRISREAYRSASRSEKSRLLDSLVQQTGLNRKTITRRLNGPCSRKPRRRQRGRRYGPEVDDALRVISEAYNFICAERLQPNLVWMAEHLGKHGELGPTARLMDQLDRISISTVRRILKRVHQDKPRRRRASQFTANARSQIPILRIPWNERRPGHWEVDLVHHCGPVASGEYLHTLVMVDVATGWCECAALLGRSYLVMQDAFSRCLQRSPIPAHEVHSDNGSEFFSAHLLSFWKERAHTPKLSRSRPYRKNDNRYVEHRNGALIRAWLGHDRLDTGHQTRALNQFYDRLWLYFNFFQPIMRLCTKSWNGARTSRTHDAARTPFDRLMQTNVLTPYEVRELATLRDNTNPRILRRQLYRDIVQLFQMPMAVDGLSEDVHATLLQDHSNRRWASE